MWGLGQMRDVEKQGAKRQGVEKAVSLSTLIILSIGSCCETAQAYELGYGGYALSPGVSAGVITGATPPPGIYMFDQAFAYQSKIVGPGAPSVGGQQTTAGVLSANVGFLFVPGWQFLGATYDAVLVQPGGVADIGTPVNAHLTGVKNTYLVPAELSWRLGNSGFFAKAGVAVYLDDGTVSGVNGLSGVGNPWWTFQPQFTLSYLNDGWNLTATIAEEFNTKNRITSYQTGDILHAEFAATRRLGAWTIGPVGYYVGQVSDDKSSAFYGQAINVNRYNVWAAGGLVGYDFGRAAFSVWGYREFSARAWGGTPTPFGNDSAAITQGTKIFASLSYRIWAPDTEAKQPERPQLFKKAY